jgi:hypothetical protein
MPKGITNLSKEDFLKMMMDSYESKKSGKRSPEASIHFNTSNNRVPTKDMEINLINYG